MEWAVETRDGVDRDAVTLSYAISGIMGFPVMPQTPARSGPITARVWLAAAVNARGQYFRPEVFGHAANLEDGESLIDSVILMAIIKRHFLTAPAAGWDDDALSDALGLPARDITRAQHVLDAAARLMNHHALSGDHWWISAPPDTPKILVLFQHTKDEQHRLAFTRPMIEIVQITHAFAHYYGAYFLSDISTRIRARARL